MIATMVAAKCSTHGMSSTRVYGIWTGMMTRCYNRKAQSYPDYGGRGIRICDRWKSFEAFYADMGDPPDKYSIERIDNNGNYEPGNCSWIPKPDQVLNTRRTVWVVLFGREMPFSKACAEIGVSYQSTHNMMRRRGCTAQEIIDDRLLTLTTDN